MEEITPPPPTCLNNFKLIKKLGAGSFGQIWLAECLKKPDQHVAIKFQDVAKQSKALYQEFKIYFWLNNDPSFAGEAIPQVFYYGTEGQYNLMVMEQLGRSLSDLFLYCGKIFTLKTVIMLAEQMLNRIEYIHSRRIIHRDIKPENFAIGAGDQAHRIYILDFGLARHYMDADGKHICNEGNKNLTGTAKYASLHTHAGFQQSRRDDLEGLAYILIYFLKGELPWQGIKAKEKGNERYAKVYKKKMETSLVELCQGLPVEFEYFLEYARKLDFDEKPDYQVLKANFRKLFSKNEFEYDYKYDWIPFKKDH